MRLPARVAACLLLLGAAAPAASAQVSDITAAEAAIPLLAEVVTPHSIAEQPVPTTTAPAPGLAFEYSDGYRTRARIHRVASFATLPLFVTEAFIGQSLYDEPTDSKRDAHLVVAGGIGALFAVNTFTGAWNLLEARKDPHFGKRKWAHALLMFGGDIGMVTTAALGPGEGNTDGKAAHRAAAITTAAMATTGYLIMLFGN